MHGYSYNSSQDFPYIQPSSATIPIKRVFYPAGMNASFSERQDNALQDLYIIIDYVKSLLMQNTIQERYIYSTKGVFSTS